MKLISFNSGQLQNKTVNGAISITINCVITVVIVSTISGFHGKIS